MLSKGILSKEDLSKIFSTRVFFEWKLEIEHSFSFQKKINQVPSTHRVVNQRKRDSISNEQLSSLHLPYDFVSCAFNLIGWYSFSSLKNRNDGTIYEEIIWTLFDRLSMEC